MYHQNRPSFPNSFGRQKSFRLCSDSAESRLGRQDSISTMAMALTAGVDSRNPVNRVVMVELAQHRLRQVQALDLPAAIFNLAIT